jgi:predicted nucleotide-binding protein
MPIDEGERKSLAYNLYRGIVESNDAGNGTVYWMYHEDWETNVLEFQRDFFDLLVRAMEEIYNAQTSSSETDPDEARTMSKNVFVVHGHDVVAKLLVQNFLHRLGLTPIVLHEQENRGSVLIEKLERESRRAQFAIILLTPDDRGCAASDPDPRPRTRQNVVFEWGLFVGLLGRKNVCALRVGSVEIPSDMSGIVWENMDGPWEAKIAKEMRAAGLDVDLNNI